MRNPCWACCCRRQRTAPRSRRRASAGARSRQFENFTNASGNWTE
jgi:hypothetical protein